MKKCSFSTIEFYNKLIVVFPEFKTWMEKDVLEIKKFLKKDYVVLDVGVGFGREIKGLAPFCKKIIGIDNDPKEVENAKLNTKDTKNVEFFVEDAKKTHFPNEYFDIILCLGNTLGNVGDDKEEILCEMRRLLKKDGKILISVYSKGNTRKRIEAYEKIGLKIKYVDKEKVIFEEGLISEEFSKDELKELFNRVGLKAKFKDINSIAVLCIVEKLK